MKNGGFLPQSCSPYLTNPAGNGPEKTEEAEGADGAEGTEKRLKRLKELSGLKGLRGHLLIHSAAFVAGAKRFWGSGSMVPGSGSRTED